MIINKLPMFHFLGRLHINMSFEQKILETFTICPESQTNGITLTDNKEKLEPMHEQCINA